MQNLNLSSRILKVVGIANRLSIAPSSLRAGVEAELMEAAKELVAADTNSNQPVDRAEVETMIADYQSMANRAKDGAERVRLVNRIRDLKNQLRG